MRRLFNVVPDVILNAVCPWNLRYLNAHVMDGYRRVSILLVSRVLFAEPGSQIPHGELPLRRQNMPFRYLRPFPSSLREIHGRNMMKGGLEVLTPQEHSPVASTKSVSDLRHFWQPDRQFHRLGFCHAIIKNRSLSLSNCIKMIASRPTKPQQDTSRRFAGVFKSSFLARGMFKTYCMWSAPSLPEGTLSQA